MSGLGAGLARGLAAYGQGRMIADDRDYRRAQDELQRQRLEAKDREDAEYRKAMMAQMADQMRRGANDDRIKEEERGNRYRSDGFRPVDEAQATGQALGAGAGFASLGGPLGAAGGALAQYGQAMQDGVKRPDAVVGGRGMVRMAESDTERTTRIADQTRRGELMQQAQQQANKLEEIRGILRTIPNKGQAIAAMAVDLPTAQSLLGKYADQRMAPPRQESPVNMQVIQTADGPMAFNPRTGRAEPITAGGRPVGAPQQVGGKMTEGQRRVSGLAEMAEAERRKLDELGTPGFTDRVLAKVPFGMGEPLMSDRGQQYLSAAEAFSRPYLYAVSGQNATDGEVRSTARQSIPGIFTRETTDSDMKQRRARMVDGIRIIAGQPVGETATGASTQNANADAIRSQAVQAIQRGADPAAVRKRFEETTGQRWED